MCKRVIQIFVVLTVLSLLAACGGTDQPEPTATPEPTPTPKPQGFPGWEKFEGGGISLWLPESFEGGDISQDMDLILDVINNLGPDFEQVGQLIAQNPDAFVIYVFDIDPDNMQFITSVNVTRERTLSAVQLSDYLDAALSQFPEVMTVTEAGLTNVGDYDAARVVLQYSIEGIEIAQLIYIFKSGSTFYNIAYSTSGAEFYDRLPEFEQSASSITFSDTE